MRIQKGFNITRESWQVLRKDRELLVFPILSAIAATLIVATIVSAGLLIPNFGQLVKSMLDEERTSSIGEQSLGIACLFVIYFVEWSIAVYFNTALVGCALIRFSGGDPTIKDGFRIATKRLPQVLAWALFTSAVGTILSAIEKNLGWFGKLVVRLVGLSWAVATYFVVPVLAEEGVGPITAVRRSVGLLRKTWGEALTGNIVIHLASWGVAFILIGSGLFGFTLAVFFESVVMAVATGAILVLCLVLMGIVTSALRQVFLAGLYEYAKTGSVPDGFSENSMRGALTTSR
jgi:hypothetical protein